MAEDIMERIISDISEKESRIGTFCDMPQSLYEPVPFDRKNFHNPIGHSDNTAKIIFIDGGNNEIIASPHFSLHLVRVYATVYSANKRQHIHRCEFFALASAEKQEIVMKYYPVKGDYVPVLASFSIKSSISSKMTAACEKARKLAELDIAARLASELGKGDIIVRDGDLSINDGYEKASCDSLFKTIKEKNIILCGLSKSTALLTDTGHSLASALQGIAPDSEWFYCPLFRNKNPSHPAHVYIARLHKTSGYVFRIDVYDRMDYDIERIFLILKENSKDPVFPGYPYGLIEADRFARVSDSESLSSRMRLKALSGKRWKDIGRSIAASDAHSILDNIG